MEGTLKDHWHPTPLSFIQTGSHLWTGGQNLLVQWSQSLLFLFVWNNKEFRWFKRGNLGWVFQHNAQKCFKTGDGWNDKNQTQNQNEVACLRSPTFSPCSWGTFILHVNRNVRAVQRLKWNLVTVFDYQRGFWLWEIWALLRGHQMQQRKYPLDMRKSFSLWAWKYTETVVQFFLRDFQDLSKPDPDVLDLPLKYNLLWSRDWTGGLQRFYSNLNYSINLWHLWCLPGIKLCEIHSRYKM